MSQHADTDRDDDDIDVSDIAELGAGFFEGAILTRSGENLIDTVRASRAMGVSNTVTS